MIDHNNRKNESTGEDIGRHVAVECRILNYKCISIQWSLLYCHRLHLLLHPLPSLLSHLPAGWWVCLPLPRSSGGRCWRASVHYAPHLLALCTLSPPHRSQNEPVTIWNLYKAAIHHIRINSVLYYVVMNHQESSRWPVKNSQSLLMTDAPYLRPSNLTTVKNSSQLRRLPLVYPLLATSSYAPSAMEATVTIIAMALE